MTSNRISLYSAFLLLLFFSPVSAQTSSFKVEDLSNLEQVIATLGRLKLVPSEENEISVVGEVHAPQVIQMKRQMSMIEALAYAGGLTKESASEIKVLRKMPKSGYIVERTLNVQEIRNGEIDLLLHSGDILIVPKSSGELPSRKKRFMLPGFPLFVPGTPLPPRISPHYV